MTELTAKPPIYVGVHRINANMHDSFTDTNQTGMTELVAQLPTRMTELTANFPTCMAEATAKNQICVTQLTA